MAETNIEQRETNKINDKLMSIKIMQTKDRCSLFADGKHSGSIMLSLDTNHNDLLLLSNTLGALNGIHKSFPRGTDIVCGIMPEHDAFDVAEKVLEILKKNSFITDEESIKISDKLRLTPDSSITAPQTSERFPSSIQFPTGNLFER